MSVVAALVLAASVTPQAAQAETSPVHSRVSATARATVTILRPAQVDFEAPEKDTGLGREAMQRQVNRHGERILIEFT